MGALDTLMGTDGAALVNSDEFGEAVTYTTRTGTATSIKAVIVREPLQFIAGGPAQQASLEAHVRRHATLGVTSVDTGGDTITVAERYGGTAKAWYVREVIHSDAGMWILRLG